MNEIRRLSEHTINQIAAGEVIERPASVIKELVENSIDAGASRIEIDVVDGGKKLIKVMDNGTGIRAGEIELAFEKHATSKIGGIEDVYSLGTMGFRGEALASIASVAKVEAITKHRESEESVGIRIFIAGGKTIYVESTPAPTGTSIKVMELFYNLPARKKYLKKTATELKHIVDVINGLAMINPGIHFILKNNRRPVMNYPSCDDEMENLFHILGAGTAREMIPVEGRSGSVVLKGFIGAPSVSRSTRSAQWFFVNGRPVASKTIREALEDGFKNVLMRKKFPAALLSIKTKPAEIDVNIHPTKREIKFEKPDGIYAVVFEAVTKGLGTTGISMEKISTMVSPKGADHGMSPTRAEELETDPGTGISPLQTTLMETASIAGGVAPCGPVREELAGASFTVRPKYYDDYRENAERHHLPLLRPIGQIHDLYILAQDEEGLVIIDQHALHERIMLEKVAEQYNRRAMAVQELIIPLDIKLNAAQSAVFAEWKEKLERTGFGIEHFGGDHYRVRHIPASIQLREAKRLVLDIIDRLTEDERQIGLDEMEEEILKMTACRSAIKAGQTLDRDGINSLFSQMYRAVNPYFCAHGRPTMVKLSLSELEKKFKRKV